MTCDQIINDIARQQIADLRISIQKEQDVNLLRLKAAKLAEILDLALQARDEMGQAPPSEPQRFPSPLSGPDSPGTAWSSRNHPDG